MRIAISAVVLALVLSSCASGYQSFYEPAPGATQERIDARRANPPPAFPQVERIAPGDPQDISAAYQKRGYEIIGVSSFNSGGSVNDEGAIKHGKVVGADLVVLINPQYTGTVSSVVPLTTPTSTTSRTTGSATAYTPNGPITAYGSSTTTTYGTKTTYIPMSTDRYDYAALYMVKVKYRVGLYTRPLDDEERQRYETNRGAIVRLVVDGTPAFYADILPGDMLLSLHGHQINSPEEFSRLADQLAGTTVDVRLLRNGREITKQLTLAK